MSRHTTIKVGKMKPASDDAETSASIRYRNAQLARLFDLAVQALDGDETNPALLRELGGISRAMTGNDAEIRQQEKHSKNMVARMTPAERDELVVAYLREATKERRLEIIAELKDMDKGSVL